MDLPRLLDLWHTVTRGVASRRRLAAALLTGVAVLAALHILRPAPPTTVRVWVAAHALAGGRALVTGDLASEALPTADVPVDSVRATTVIAGRLLSAPMTRGEPMTAVRLLGPSLLVAAGLPADVAVPVRVTDGPATIELVHAGDLVDILAAPDGDGAPATDDTAVETVAHDVRVLATPARDSTDDGETAGLLIVAATSAQATSLAQVAGTARLSVAVASTP